MKKVKNTDMVSLHYTGTLSDGEKFDSSEGREPLKFQVGAGMVIPGFDKEVVGMEVNESKTFTVASGEAYGDVKQELLYKVPKSSIPKEIEPQVGLRLVSNLEDGRQIPVTVTEVEDETITLDANHPLAGKDLTFEIKIVSID